MLHAKSLVLNHWFLVLVIPGPIHVTIHLNVNPIHLGHWLLAFGSWYLALGAWVLAFEILDIRTNGGPPNVFFPRLGCHVLYQKMQVTNLIMTLLMSELSTLSI